MKKGFVFLLCFFMLGASMAQSAQDAILLKRVELANNTVFGTKDSATLDNLLASQLSYGHSGGKVENRQETLHNATTNGNTYAGTKMDGFTVFYSNKKTAIVRFLMTSEQTTKGETTKLNFNMLQVWVNEKKEWKMAARQAVKLK